MLGSRSFTDGLSDDEIDAAESREGKKLRQALADAGLAERPRERLEPSRYTGYLEAHIEQGDTLDSRGLRIGIVEAIIGSWNYWRSEEHTSELQSHLNIVCRLLLEKKKKK